MSTTQSVVWETKRLLEGNLVTPQNTLDGAILAGATSLALSETINGIAVGTELEIDQELFRVLSVQGSTVTVKGARRGTTAANHADGSDVFISPRFAVSGIVSALNATLAEMEAEGLFRETALDITYQSGVSGYDLTGSTTVLDVLAVGYQDEGSEQRYPRIGSWSLRRNMPTSTFPSGNSLVLDRGGISGLPLRVVYAAPFTRATALDDDLETDLGVPVSMHDIVSLGTSLRQMQGRDARRSYLEAQTDTRRSNEVPIGASQAAMTTMMRSYKDRLGQERMRLVQRYPYLNRR